MDDRVQPNYWAWFASGDGGEFYRVGPCNTREECIAQATSEELGAQRKDGQSVLRFHICEAKQSPLRLSEWIPDAETLLEYADNSIADSDRAHYEFDEPPYFDGISPDQKAELWRDVKAAVDAWQDRHQLAWKLRTFASSRNEETVVVPLAANVS